MTSDYRTVKIPENLANEADDLIGRHGFTSRAEVVKAALRRLLQDYKKEEKESTKG